MAQNIPERTPFRHFSEVISTLFQSTHTHTHNAHRISRGVDTLLSNLVHVAIIKTFRVIELCFTQKPIWLYVCITLQTNEKHLTPDMPNYEMCCSSNLRRRKTSANNIGQNECNLIANGNRLKRSALWSYLRKRTNQTMGQFITRKFRPHVLTESGWILSQLPSSVRFIWSMYRVTNTIQYNTARSLLLLRILRSSRLQTRSEQNWSRRWKWNGLSQYALRTSRH